MDGPAKLRHANVRASLYVLRDGTLLCLHGSYARGMLDCESYLVPMVATPGSHRHAIMASWWIARMATVRRWSWMTDRYLLPTSLRADTVPTMHATMPFARFDSAYALTILASTCFQRRIGNSSRDQPLSCVGADRYLRSEMRMGGSRFCQSPRLCSHRQRASVLV